jgi:hypothetical protein
MPDPKPLPESIEKAIRRTIDVHANVNVAALRLAIAHELALRDAVVKALRRVRVQAEVVAKTADKDFMGFSKFLQHVQLAATSGAPLDLGLATNELHAHPERLADAAELLQSLCKDADALDREGRSESETRDR